MAEASRWLDSAGSFTVREETFIHGLQISLHRWGAAYKRRSEVRMSLAGALHRPWMPVFHLECSIYRRCASGLSVAAEQLEAPTVAQAANEAEARFELLLAGRSGCAILRDDGGNVIWSTRRLPQVTRDTDPPITRSAR